MCDRGFLFELSSNETTIIFRRFLWVESSYSCVRLGEKKQRNRTETKRKYQLGKIYIKIKLNI